MGATTELTTARDLVEAVALAEGAFPAGETLADHRLISAELVLADRPAGAGVRVWRLTFKRVRLLPSSVDAPIGAGGEVFIAVDLDAKTATVTGGE